MPSASTYRFYPDARLSEFIALYEEGIRAVMEGGTSYTMNGVSFTRANLESREESLGFMYAEQAKRNGSAPRVAHPIVRRRHGGHSGR